MIRCVGVPTFIQNNKRFFSGCIYLSKTITVIITRYLIKNLMRVTQKNKYNEHNLPTKISNNKISNGNVDKISGE